MQKTCIYLFALIETITVENNIFKSVFDLYRLFWWFILAMPSFVLFYKLLIPSVSDNYKVIIKEWWDIKHDLKKKLI